MKQPPLDALPRLPRDADGPVFHAPWQAEAFALAVALNARGVFSWTRWAAVLAEELARAEASPLPGAQHTHPEGFGETNHSAPQTAATDHAECCAVQIADRVIKQAELLRLLPVPGQQRFAPGHQIA